MNFNWGNPKKTNKVTNILVYNAAFFRKLSPVFWRNFMPTSPRSKYSTRSAYLGKFFNADVEISDFAKKLLYLNFRN